MNILRFYLNQSYYIDSILEQFEISTCHSVFTPFITNYNLSLQQCPQTKDKHASYKLYFNSINYLLFIGLLLYTTQTCPDVQFAVNLLACFSDNLEIAYFAACKRVLQYLKSTKEYSLKLGSLSTSKMCLVG